MTGGSCLSQHPRCLDILRLGNKSARHELADAASHSPVRNSAWPLISKHKRRKLFSSTASFRTEPLVDAKADCVRQLPVDWTSDRLPNPLWVDSYSPFALKFVTARPLSYAWQRRSTMQVCGHR
ncbi:hypothetical protein BDW71DRAFT_18248 [Aspergillus fruticulosus]